MPPELLQGGLAVDDRGDVAFVNEFAFADVKRFYTVSNHAVGFVRAWHAHRNEAKYVLAVSGALLVGCVEIDDWERPSRDLEVHRFVLSERDDHVFDDERWHYLASRGTPPPLNLTGPRGARHGAPRRALMRGRAALPALRVARWQMPIASTCTTPRLWPGMPR